MRNYIRTFVVASTTLLGTNVYAQSGPPVPTGIAIKPDDIIKLMENIGGFLMALGGILAAIVLIVSGIAYLLAGSSQQKVASAKGMFKAGIIGALIIFGAGVIINTVRVLAENPLGFFNG